MFQGAVSMLFLSYFGERSFFIRGFEHNNCCDLEKKIKVTVSRRCVSIFSTKFWSIAHRHFKMGPICGRILKFFWRSLSFFEFWPILADCECFPICLALWGWLVGWSDALRAQNSEKKFKSAKISQNSKKERERQFFLKIRPDNYSAGF